MKYSLINIRCLKASHQKKKTRISPTSVKQTSKKHPEHCQRSKNLPIFCWKALFCDYLKASFISPWPLPQPPHQDKAEIKVKRSSPENSSRRIFSQAFLRPKLTARSAARSKKRERERGRERAVECFWCSTVLRSFVHLLCSTTSGEVYYVEIYIYIFVGGGISSPKLQHTLGRVLGWDVQSAT